MTHQFYVGQKVACINATFARVSIDQQIREGEIYTVREVLPWKNYVDGEYIGLRLAEIDRGVCEEYGDVDPPFHAKRFRPLVTDRLGSLRALLVSGQPLAPSKEEPRRKTPVREGAPVREREVVK